MKYTYDQKKKELRKIRDTVKMGILEDCLNDLCHPVIVPSSDVFECAKYGLQKNFIRRLLATINET